MSGVGKGELMEGDKKRKGSECFVLDKRKNKIGKDHFVLSNKTIL